MTSARAVQEANFTAARTRVPFRIEVASSLETFAGQWPTTAERGDARCYPFQCADILHVWCDTIGRANDIEPVFVRVVAPDGDPLFLLPWGIEKSSGTRVLRFLDGGVSDYNAPVVYPRAASIRLDKNELWQQLQSCLPPFDLAALEKMPDTIEDLPNPLIGLSTEDHPESGHGVTLSGSWDEFARERLPRWSDSRRCLRNLSKLGKVSFEIARTEDEQRHFIETLFRQKQRRYKETAASGIFDEPSVGDFYMEATRIAGKHSVLVSGLKLDDEILAANWGLILGDHYFDLMTSNEGGKFRTYSPGRLLNEWLLEWCLSNGIKISDFGIGDESYKFRYCDIHTPLKNAYIATTARGAMHVKALRLRETAKRLIGDTRIGTALKTARNWLSKRRPDRHLTASGQALPGWLAVLGSAMLAIDA